MQCIRVAASFAALALMASTASAQKVVDRALARITVDPDKVATPELRFTETEADRAGYDKYFYFVAKARISRPPTRTSASATRWPEA